MLRDAQPEPGGHRDASSPSRCRPSGGRPGRQCIEAPGRGAQVTCGAQSRGRGWPSAPSTARLRRDQVALALHPSLAASAACRRRRCRRRCIGGLRSGASRPRRAPTVAVGPRRLRALDDDEHAPPLEPGESAIWEATSTPALSAAAARDRPDRRERGARHGRVDCVVVNGRSIGSGASAVQDAVRRSACPRGLRAHDWHRAAEPITLEDASAATDVARKNRRLGPTVDASEDDLAGLAAAAQQGDASSRMSAASVSLRRSFT